MNEHTLHSYNLSVYVHVYHSHVYVHVLLIISMLSLHVIFCFFFLLPSPVTDTDDFENRFPFHTDIPPPERWTPGPKLYPSKNKNTSAAGEHSWCVCALTLLIGGAVMAEAVVHPCHKQATAAICAGLI